MGTATWDTVEPAPIVLVHGMEDLLVERATNRVTTLVKENNPDVEITELEGATYAGGALTVATSPSLFADANLVLIRGAQAATDDLITDVITYIQSPAPDAIVVIEHGGGQRGKKMLDAIRNSGAPAVTCDPLKKDADKAQFVTGEFRKARRRVDAGAVRALVEAVGSDLRELAAACSQLIADTTGTVNSQTVEKYYGGRVEATGFRVADAALLGERAQAIALTRHALATGLDPVPIIAVLALKLRTLAKVAAMRGRNLNAKDLGLAPWQVDRARKDLRNWTPEGLAVAISAVAAADAEVKGAARDPLFAVERAILRICDAAGT